MMPGPSGLSLRLFYSSRSLPGSGPGPPRTGAGWPGPVRGAPSSRGSPGTSNDIARMPAGMPGGHTAAALAWGPGSDEASAACDLASYGPPAAARTSASGVRRLLLGPSGAPSQAQPALPVALASLPPEFKLRSRRGASQASKT